MVGDHKRHAHLQKCHHSRNGQSHPKIREGEGQVGVVKAGGAAEVVVVEYKEVKHSHPYPWSYAVMSS